MTKERGEEDLYIERYILEDDYIKYCSCKEFIKGKMKLFTHCIYMMMQKGMTMTPVRSNPRI